MFRQGWRVKRMPNRLAVRDAGLEQSALVQRSPTLPGSEKLRITRSICRTQPVEFNNQRGRHRGFIHASVSWRQPLDVKPRLGGCQASAYTARCRRSLDDMSTPEHDHLGEGATRPHGRLLTLSCGAMPLL